MNFKPLILFFILLSPLFVSAQAGDSWSDINEDKERLEKYLSELDESKELSRDSLQILLKSGYAHFLQTGFKEGQAKILIRMGHLYSEQHMFNAAADAYQESIALFTALEDS